MKLKCHFTRDVIFFGDFSEGRYYGFSAEKGARTFREWRIVPFGEETIPRTAEERGTEKGRRETRENPRTIFLLASRSFSRVCPATRELTHRFDFANSRNKVPARCCGATGRQTARFSRIYVKYFAVLSIVLLPRELTLLAFESARRVGFGAFPICPRTSHDVHEG